MALHRPDAARPRTLVGARPSPGAPAAAPAVAQPPKIGDPELEAMREADRQIDASMRPLSERGKRRWKAYVLGSMVFFPLATWMLTPAGLNGLWLQLIVAALYGTFLAFARPTGILAALVTLLAGVVTQAIAGTPTGGFHGLLLTLGLCMYATLGFILGMTLQAAHVDGE